MNRALRERFASQIIFASLKRGPDGRRQSVQLAELGMQSWKERKWVDVPDLDCSAATPR